MAEQATVVVKTEGKNMVLAYVLWFFLGVFGIRRFYLERPGTGVAQLLLWVVGAFTLMFGIGFVLMLIAGIWWLVDAFLVQSIVTEYNRKHDAPGAGGVRLVTTGGSSEDSNNLSQLERLYDLKEKGAISASECTQSASPSCWADSRGVMRSVACSSDWWRPSATCGAARNRSRQAPPRSRAAARNSMPAPNARPPA